MFAVLMQMHERYLTYAAAMSVILIGYRFGFILLHLAITLFATMLLYSPWHMNRDTPWLRDFLSGANPGAGWAVLLLAALCWWITITPKRHPHIARPLGRDTSTSDEDAPLASPLNLVNNDTIV